MLMNIGREVDPGWLWFINPPKMYVRIATISAKYEDLTLRFCKASENEYQSLWYRDNDVIYSLCCDCIWLFSCGWLSNWWCLVIIVAFYYRPLKKHLGAATDIQWDCVGMFLFFGSFPDCGDILYSSWGDRQYRVKRLLIVISIARD